MFESVVGEDGVKRCWWGNDPEIYRVYHDDEWGMPVDDDRILFEKLCLEGFQAGLSWLTILKRREGFRAAFHGFDIERVAEMRESDVERLLQDTGIIRHRGKIESTLNNARRALEIIADLGSLGALVWSFEPEQSWFDQRCNDSGVHRPVQGAEEKRVHVPRSDNGLCLHAGDGHRQRSPARLRSVATSRFGPGRLHPSCLGPGVADQQRKRQVNLGDDHLIENIESQPLVEVHV